jgi:hypothetical protein
MEEVLWNWVFLVDPVLPHQYSILGFLSCGKTIRGAVQFEFLFLSSITPEYPYRGDPKSSFFIQLGYSDNMIAAIDDPFQITLSR